MLNQGFNLLGSIVVLGMVAVFFKSKQSGPTVKAFWDGFSGSIKNAETG